MFDFLARRLATRCLAERDDALRELAAEQTRYADAAAELRELRETVTRVATATSNPIKYRPDAESHGTFAWENIVTMDVEVVRNALGKYAPTGFEGD